ncbi:MAG: hypothetical protein DRZ82_01530 [Thermoprotei archaeon]|nr:MAG: hypothetical protein DRZ82_01530 [Thermoprotei archaeon]
MVYAKGIKSNEEYLTYGKVLNMRGVPIVIIWLDCVPGDVFVNMYSKGELKNIEEFFENGVMIDNVITCFPTVTEAAEGGIISGLFAGETNMVGERYFSRKLGMVMHYKLNASPEMDLSPKAKERIIDTIVGDSISMGRLIRTSHEVVYDLLAKSYEKVGSLKMISRIIETISKIVYSRRPRLLFFTISSDTISHMYGRNSNEVQAFIKEVDRNFPKLINSLDDVFGKGQYLVFLFSDHGIADVRNHLDLPILLLDYGFKPASTDVIISEESNAAALSNGRRMGLLYFAHPERGWRAKPSYKMLRNYRLKGRNVDLPKLLSEEEGIEHVFIKRDERTVMVISEQGEALIEYDAITNRYRYRVIRGDDPMEYDLVPSWMSEEELLRRTITSPYPDGVVQVFNLFRAENCGDLVVNAAPNWDFWEEWDMTYRTLRAAHGGLSKDEMKVFLLVKGPYIKGSKTRYARLLDIFATIATYYNAARLVRDTHAIDRMKYLESTS